jgi:septin family protein
MMMRLAIAAALAVVGSANDMPLIEEDQPSVPLLVMPELRRGLARQYEGRLEAEGAGITVMVVGESGTGKTSLLSNLFQTHDIKWDADDEPGARTTRVREQSISFQMTDDARAARMGKAGMPFTARLVDSPGWGDTLSLKRSFSIVTKYIDAQFAAALRAERMVNRPMPHEGAQMRPVDIVLYVFAPHRCKEIDMHFLRLLSKRVEIVPILAKADTMTTRELAKFKQEVSDAIADAGVTVLHPPLAIICGEAAAAGRAERQYPEDVIDKHGRRYPWGIALAEHESPHSQLPTLRKLLLTDGLLQLQQASGRRYEEYRRRALGMGILRRARLLVQGLLCLYPVVAACMGAEQRASLNAKVLSAAPAMPIVSVRWRKLGGDARGRADKTAGRGSRWSWKPAAE